jgi:hypothetical protein
MRNYGQRRLTGRGWHHGPGCHRNSCGGWGSCYFDGTPERAEALKAYLQDLEEEVAAVKEDLKRQDSDRQAK